MVYDNNAAERAMRPIPLGWKNWMFAGSNAGGERAAAIYSLSETKLNRPPRSVDRPEIRSKISFNILNLPQPSVLQ